MKMKRIIALLTALVLALALTACGETKPNDDVQQGGAAVEKKITIGCCVMDLSNEIFVQYAEGYNQFLKDTKGTVEINLVDGGGNVATQVQAIEDFISMGVDGIMLNALDTSAVEDVIQKAMDAGIKVGVYPSMENVTFNFVFDEYDWGYTEGEEAAKWIDEKLGGSATIMSFAQAENSAVMERYQGIVDGVNENVKDPSKVVWLEYSGTDNTSEAMTAMESVLQAHPEVRMVLCAQDSAAVGAYQAVISSGLPQEEFFVAGCDGISEALGYIEEGTPYRLSIANAKLTSQMGYELVQNVSMAVAGLDYESPYYAAVAAVNADNVKDYLAQTPTYTLNPELAAYLGIN